MKNIKASAIHNAADPDDSGSQSHGDHNVESGNSKRMQDEEVACG